MKLVCLGDSITYGYRVRRKESWVSLLSERSGISVVNKGIVGDTTSGMLSRFERDVLREKPTHVMIMGGSNDFVCEMPISIVKANIFSMVCQSYHYGILPLLGIPIPMVEEEAKKFFQFSDDFEKINSNIEEYRNWLINFSSLSQCKYLDFYSIFIDSKTESLKRDLYIDGIHPTKEGNLKIFDYVMSVLKL
ncbi:MAG: arylesterase [Tissierellaceae bacterium]|nr:arylesterase [Tissierellaceae bacterium]